MSVIGTAICDTLNLYMLTSLCVILSLSGRRLVSATFTCINVEFYLNKILF